MATVRCRFPPEELRAPVSVEPVRAAEVIFIGDIVPLGRVALVQGDPLLVMEYLDPAFGVMDQGLLTYIAVRHTVVALIRRKVNIPHLLDFGSPIVFQLVGQTRQGLEVLAFHGIRPTKYMFSD